MILRAGVRRERPGAGGVSAQRESALSRLRSTAALTAVGFTLHLPTADEIAATQARLRDEAEQQAEAAHRRQVNSWQSPYAAHGPSGLFPTAVGTAPGVA